MILGVGAYHWIALVLLAGAALLLSALFSGLETGLYVINKIRLELKAERRRRGAVVMRNLLRSGPNMLAVLLIGNNISNYAATFAVAAMFALGGFSGLKAELYTLAVATPMLFILGESVPKNVFQRRAETLTYRLAPLLWAANTILNLVLLAPLVRGFAAVLMRLVGQAGRRAPLGHEGIAAVVAEGQASGVLTHFQTIMADRVMHIRDVVLEDVMIPMRSVVSAPRDVSRDALRELISRHNYSRLPLIENGLIAGMLNIYDVLAADGDSPPADKMFPPLVLPLRMSVTDALLQMQRSRSAIAVVASDGRHVGIVTIKDLVEEIVGELEAW